MSRLEDSVMNEYLGECHETLERLNILLGQLEKDGFDPEIMRTISRDIHTIKGSSQLFGFIGIGEIAHHMEHCLERLQNASKLVLPELIDWLFKSIDFISKSFDSISNCGTEREFTAEIKAILSKFIALGDAGHQAEIPKIEDETPPQSPGPSAVVARATKTAKEAQKSPASSAKMPADDGHGDTIRVHVDLLDNLMNLVGELVLIRNQITQVSKVSEDELLFKVSQRLNIVSGELQSQVVRIRMQPIGNVMMKFHRVVRDTAKDLGKLIDFSIEGAETELDKTLIEAVRDPLTHIVRNAIDHGIEMPKDRAKAGKSETGTLSLRALHESGHVIIEVADDGRGLDRNRIIEKAIERGLTSPEHAARLSDREVFQFIFLPGFSTAEKVSSLSGRGVGMDVVKTNIEKIGGTVVMDSLVNQGTKVGLRIPLTLAIIPALIVRADSGTFAIPQVKLVELMRISREDVKAGAIEFLQDRPFYRLRGRILPLIFLKDVLSEETPSGDVLEQRFEGVESINIAVLNADRLNYGLIVDSIEDSADIVVKPIASFLKDLGVFSGATIMGDGSIALTIDVLGIAARAGAHPALGEAKDREVKSERFTLSGAAAAAEYLLVDLGHQSRFAIPLPLVSRLEEFDQSQITLSCEQQVICYRDTLLPLLYVNDILDLKSQHLGVGEANAKVPVVVVQKSGRFFGLGVNAILDVVSSASEIDGEIRDREGILGTLIEGDDIIIVLDILVLVDKAIAKYQKGQPSKQSIDEHRRRQSHQVLVVDDSSFSRRHLSSILNSAGYKVQTKNNGKSAFGHLEKCPPKTYSAIVSDVEMPEMDGMELARQIRGDQRWNNLPLFALSGRSGDADIKVGIAAGFTEYFSKVQTDELLSAIDKHLGIDEKEAGKHAV